MRSSRWLMLGLGTVAQTAGTAYLYGLAFLIPALRGEQPGASLGELGLVVAAPGLGMVLGLLAWGAAADRYGERVTVLAGLGGGAVFLSAAAFARPPWLHVLLVLAGVAGSAVYAASGRVVVGWFPPAERGLAMGIRQASQPIGVALAGVALPGLAQTGGVRLALLSLAAVSVVCCVLNAALLVDAPPAHRPDAAPAPSPYRTARLWRLHLGSAMFVGAQAVTSTFSLEYLVSERGWAPTSAGALLACGHLAAAAGRVGAGRWSDTVADRAVPLRAMAASAAVALAGLATAAALGSSATVVGLLAAGFLTVSWHGIAYAGVSEAAPPSWAGRAIAAQTTIQNVAGVLTPPLFGALIGGVGYPISYAVAAVLPVGAAMTLPSLRHGSPRVGAR